MRLAKSTVSSCSTSLSTLPQLRRSSSILRSLPKSRGKPDQTQRPTDSRGNLRRRKPHILPAPGSCCDCEHAQTRRGSFVGIALALSRGMKTTICIVLLSCLTGQYAFARDPEQQRSSTQERKALVKQERQLT